MTTENTSDALCPQLPMIVRGQNATVIDAAGRKFTDYFLCDGALICGHAHRNVVLATRKRVNRGVSYGMPTKAEQDMRAFIRSRVPAMENLFFVHSDVDALLGSITCAQDHTKRKRVIIFEAPGDYSEGNRGERLGMPHNKMLSVLGADCIVLPYNDSARVLQTLNDAAQKIACVLLEPVNTRGGLIAANEDFLITVRESTQKVSSVLIFDEISTGFRVHPFGRYCTAPIMPDMRCLGKVMGGGFPLYAVGGNADIMGSFSVHPNLGYDRTQYNPVIMRAGLATIKQLNAQFFKVLDTKAQWFCDEFNQFCVQEEIFVRCRRFHSLLSIVFGSSGDEGVVAQCQESNYFLYKKLFQYLLDCGILFPYTNAVPFSISGVHKKKDLVLLLDILKRYFKAT